MVFPPYLLFLIIAFLKYYRYVKFLCKESENMLHFFYFKNI